MKKLLIVLGLIFIGCGSKTNPEKSDKVKVKAINIVTTTNILGDLIRQIAPKEFKVNSLMRAGVDPHYYKASQGDLVKLQKADMIIYNGLHLEGKMGEVLKQLSKRKTVIDASEALLPTDIRKTGDFVSGQDPHYWFDISLWIKVGKKISQKLKTDFPENKAEIEQNSLTYFNQLEELQKTILSDLKTVPENRRILYTAHDAFGYLGRAYNIEVYALQGLSTTTEFGIKDIQNTVNTIIEKDIPAVFIESSVSPKAMKSVVEQCESKGKRVEIGGELFSDSLGEENSEEGTYIGMMKHNIQTFINAVK
jgi:manganese/zinc/iron transport system substrate-binding protein